MRMINYITVGILSAVALSSLLVIFTMQSWISALSYNEFFLVIMGSMTLFTFSVLGFLFIDRSDGVAKRNTAENENTASPTPNPPHAPVVAPFVKPSDYRSSDELLALPYDPQYTGPTFSENQGNDSTDLPQIPYSTDNSSPVQDAIVAT